MKTIGELTAYILKEKEKGENYTKLGSVGAKIYESMPLQFYITTGSNVADMKFEGHSDTDYHIAIRPEGAGDVVHLEGRLFKTSETIESLLAEFPNGSNIEIIVAALTDFEG